jgi:small subunit ribosomal protein S8
MIITHPLSNFFSNLYNHSKAKKIQMCHPQSKFIVKIADLLIKEGFIGGYMLTKDQKIRVYLRNGSTGSYISKIKMLSTPGKRVYLNNSEIFGKNNIGLFILSTSVHGLISLADAKRLNCGGELICHIL